MKTTTSLYLIKTYGEWEMIDEVVLESGKKDFSRYLKAEIHNLITKFKDCPDCITPGWGPKEKRRTPVSKEQMNELKIIADVMKTSPSDVVRKFILEPLLIPK